jgi:uncharacterized protein
MTKNTSKNRKSNKSRIPNPRQIYIFRIAIIILIVAFAAFLIVNNLFPGKSGNENKEYIFRKQGELTFFDSTGNAETKINIQIANTEFDRELGLMFRRSMEQNQGMLFIFPEAEIQSFWMRNTYISLDMIFINANKKIITIHKKTTPLSDQSYRSTGPAKYVLEVDSGFTNRNDISVGDKVNWNKTQ